MTIYICQCPHRGDAKIWTAANEAEAISIIEDQFSEAFESLGDAVGYDHRIGYHTDDPLDLLMWVTFHESAIATRAKASFLKSRDIRFDVEELATREIVNGETVYRAFDNRFTWDVETDTWTVDNQEPKEADSLFEALCAAHIALTLESSMGSVDV